MRRAGRLVLSAVVFATQLPTAAISSYLAVITASAWGATRRGRGHTELPGRPTTSFLVMIPAHDEERLLGATLASLDQLDYPPDLLSVHVVADHCTDGTVELARRHGVDVHEHDRPDARGKGAALQWMYSRLVARGTQHDAVVVIDADTVVSPNFLAVMDARLVAGALAVQAYYAVRQPEESTGAALRSAALSVRHYLRPLGRAALGGSCGLFGNGMVFTAATQQAHAWSGHLTEDIEFQMSLLLEGTIVDFAPDAVVEAEMPSTLAGARSQNERWERGRIDLARRFVPLLVQRARRATGRHRVALADAACDHLVPPLSVLVASSGAAAVLSLLAPRDTRLGTAARVLAVTSLVAQCVCVISGLRMVRAPAAVWRSLLAAPRLVVWKVGLWLRVARTSDEVRWVRTARNEDAT